MIQYTEPDEWGEPKTVLVTERSAIMSAKNIAWERGHKYDSDEEALQDFMTIHWANEVPDMYNHSDNIDKFLERIYDKIQIRTRKDFVTTTYQARLEFAVNYMVSDFEYSESELEDADKFFRELVKKRLATYIYHDVNSS